MNFNLNISKYIGLLHLSGMMIENTYGFIFVTLLLKNNF